MCKKLCSKSYFPIGRSSFLTGGDNLKLWWIECFRIKSRGKSISGGHFCQNIFLICTVVLLYSSAAFFGVLSCTWNHKSHFWFITDIGGLVSSVHFQWWGETQRKEEIDVSEIIFVGSRSLTNRCRGNEAAIPVSLPGDSWAITTDLLSHLCQYSSTKPGSGLSCHMIVLVVAEMLSWEGCRASALYQYCR